MLKSLFRFTMLILIIYVLTFKAYAYTPERKSIEIIENQLYNQTFSGNSLDDRLSRIEKTIFARTYQDPIGERLDRLKNFTQNISSNSVNYNNKNEQSFENSEQFYPQYENRYQNKNRFNYAQENSPRYMSNENSITDYPAITGLERNVFHQVYNGENIYSRLLRLESKVFGTTFPNNSLSDRMEKLQSAIGNGYSGSNYESSYVRDNFFEDNIRSASGNSLFDAFKSIASPILSNFLYSGNTNSNYFSPLSDYYSSYDSYTPGGGYHNRTTQGATGVGVRILPY